MHDVNLRELISGGVQNGIMQVELTPAKRSWGVAAIGRFCYQKCRRREVEPIKAAMLLRVISQSMNDNLIERIGENEKELVNRQSNNGRSCAHRWYRGTWDLRGLGASPHQ